jgi:serine protease
VYPIGTSDGNADVIARDTSGRLWLYGGNGAGALHVGREIGQGFNGYTITNAADLNGTEVPDALARDSAGVLWFYPVLINYDTTVGTGPYCWTGFSGSRIRIGGGWNLYTIRGPGDSSGDGKADILARDSAGLLWLYPTRVRVASRPAPWSAGAGRG